MTDSPILQRIRRIAAGLFVAATAAVGGLAAQLAADADVASPAASPLDTTPVPANATTPSTAVPSLPAAESVPALAADSVPSPPVDTTTDVPAQHVPPPSEQAPATTPYLSNRTSRDRVDSFEDADAPQWTPTPAPTTTHAPPHAHTEGS